MDGSDLRLRSSPVRWTAGAIGLGFILTTLILLGSGGGPSVTQPITFNHAKHLENGMSCPDCHTGVERQAHATLPTVDTCMNCHAAALTESAEEEKIRALAAAGRSISWVQLTHVPPHVYFSHRRHVTQAKLACAGCHGPMEKAVVPPTRVFREFTMDGCIECHEKNRAGTDCNDCHQ